MNSNKYTPQKFFAPFKKEDCCGCSACYSVCPTNAIVMELDVEGFLYPTIVSNKCIGCNLCVKVCSFNQSN